MADRLRTVLAALPAAAVVVAAWALLEDPVAWPGFALATGLALTPAFVVPVWGRAAVALAATVTLLAVVFDTWPHRGLDAAWTALHDAPAVRAPFDPGSYPALDGLVVLAAFGLALGAVLAASARRFGVLAAAVAVGVGFPAVLIEDTHALVLGAAALAAVLWASVVQGAGDTARAARGLALGAGLVVVAGAIATAGLTPTAAHVDWRGWDPFADGGRRANVAYVWDAHYGGIEFPARPTVVLRVRAPKRAEYWRVSTLETFADDRWIENLYPVALAGPRRRLPADPLVPRRDARPGAWLRQRVTVEGLEESKIAAASQPARIDGNFGRVLYLDGGIMRAGRPLRRGTEYTVWSYSPSPTPRALAASPARYPDAAQRFLELGRARMPGYGVQGRERAVDRLFTDDRYQPLFAYRPLWEEARRRTARARSPYEATLLLERWFRREGNFRYEELPPQGAGPPLVDFVERTRAGYCQHYAGAMALMLRFIGIPARVAVGFTAGTWKSGVWTVTDHQAHAWVEVWFAGHGWLAFDPTPGRGLLSAVYTLASDSADAVAALGTGRFLDFTPQPPTQGGAAAPETPAVAAAEDGAPWWLAVLAVAPLILGAAIVGAKRARRSRRLRRTEPHALAHGVRAELVSALADRGAAVDPNATLSELGQATQRALAIPVAALIDALGVARYGPPDRARPAAVEARSELGRALAAARSRERPAVRVRTALSLRSFRPGLTPSAR